jgi:translation initiation factor IF-3
MGRRFHGPVKPTFEGPRVNERIRVPSVRVIDEKGEQVGILTTEDALELAQDRGFDLVEVAPQAQPPVCKIMDFGRYKYEAKKRQAESRKKQVIVEVKEIKIRPKTDQHDIDFKFRKAREFLEEGNKVKVTVRFRGREIMYAEDEAARLLQLSKRVADIAIIESPPRREGRLVNMIMAPGKRKGTGSAAPMEAAPEEG